MVKAKRDVLMQTNHTCNLPLPVFVLPGVYKFRKAAGAGFCLLVVEKTVRAHLHRAVARYGIHFNAAPQQLARNFAANVGFEAFHQPWLGSTESTAVVVKLNAVGKKRSHNIELASVVGIKKQAIEPRNGIVQGLRFGLVRRYACLLHLLCTRARK